LPSITNLGLEGREAMAEMNGEGRFKIPWRISSLICGENYLKEKERK
jgi:hypothetical protein